MIYEIEKGSYYASGFHLSPLLGANGISFNYMFDESCLYNGSDFDQVNKLAGIAWICLPTILKGPHQNSVRLGWEVKAGEIIIHAYIYRNGIRTYYPIGKAVPRRMYQAILTADSISIDGIVVATFDPVSTSYLACKLVPYFGGQKPAPHLMTVHIVWV